MVAAGVAMGGAVLPLGGVVAEVAKVAAAELRRKGMQALVDGDHVRALAALSAALELMPQCGRGTDVADLHAMLLARTIHQRNSSRDRLAG